jgi:hypothetical protein
MAQTRKCQYCKDKGLLEDMKIEIVGQAKPVRKFYHENCHNEFLKEKAFKEKEQSELDELTETIKSIYGVKDLPRQAFSLLQKLRNGDPVFGAKQKTGKRYKQGYEYTLIKETFEHCSETIHYWNSVKGFEGFMGAFKYALTIIIDKIYFVEQRVKERESKKAMIDKHVAEVEYDEHIFEHSYKKKSSDTDITNFLDD